LSYLALQLAGFHCAWFYSNAYSYTTPLWLHCNSNTVPHASRINI